MPKVDKPKAQSPKSKKVVAAQRSKTQTSTKKAPVRRVKQSTYKSFRFSKRIHQPKPPIMGSFRLFVASIRLLVKKWKLFGGIIGIYFVLTVMLVKGFGSGSNLVQLKDSISGAIHGNGVQQLVNGVTLFGVLLGNANTTPSDVASAYQSMLLIIMSLVLIWALRQCMGSKQVKVAVHDAFYKGLYPLVPVLLVMCVIGLQTLPMVFANFVYSTIFPAGLAVTPIEKGLWGMLLGLLVLLTFYMVTSSIFALYIVTLPNVRPMQALRSARELVRHRRFMVMRKLLFLPAALLVLAAVIVVPIIVLSAGLAEWVFFMLSMLGLAMFHSYVYHLYRELLV